jgi:hypothetical protein
LDIRRKFRLKPLTAYIHEKRADPFGLELLPDVLIFFAFGIQRTYEKNCFHGQGFFPHPIPLIRGKRESSRATL